MICHYYDAPSYLIYAADLPALLYYSHIPVSLFALIVGFFVFFNNPTGLLNKLLLGIALCFSGWTFINLIAWTNIESQTLTFLWTFFGILQALISILCIYFIYAFLNGGKDIALSTKATFLTLLLPVFFFAHTDLNVSGFNLSDCDAFGFEGFIYNAYFTALGVLAVLWILVLLIRRYRHAKPAFRKQILLMGAGIELFLLMFFSIVYLVSYLTNIGFFEDSDLEMYGLFGMAIFMAFVSVLIVKFKTFQVGATASTALIVALLFLTGSQFLYIESRTGAGVTAATLVLTGILAVLLLQNIRKEIAQKREIESLATDLAKANTRLKALDKQKSEFVSIASHQLRSPLTSIRGYASMLREGSFGSIPAKALETIDRIETSAKHMTSAVEDYLNVSRIESGNMKYEMSDFNLKNELEQVTDDVRPTALKKGLVLLFRTDLKSKSIVNADVGKTIQIAHNLINNSIKYTEKGTITVFLRDDIEKKTVSMDIIDTGVGMSEETIDKLFQKFSRAEDANRVNTSGTGLGLFVADKMAEAMGGNITAHSDGEGKGSRFTFTLPLAM